MPKMENPCKVRSLEQIRDKYAEKVTDQMLRFAREVQKDSFRRCAELCRTESHLECMTGDMPALCEHLAREIEQEGGL